MKTKHQHSFGFDKKFISRNKLEREPRIGERSFSIEQDDWVCSCGITRRVALNLKKLKDEEVKK